MAMVKFSPFSVQALTALLPQQFVPTGFLLGNSCAKIPLQPIGVAESRHSIRVGNLLRFGYVLMRQFFIKMQEKSLAQSGR
jgi:hypothetical protein